MLWEIWWENPCFPRNKVYQMMIRILWKKACMTINFPDFPHTMGFVAFSHVMRNKWENTCISYVIKYTVKRESNGKKAPVEKSRTTNFPGSPIPLVLLHFPVLWEINGETHAFLIWWSILTIGWESFGEKSSILSEKYEYQFHRFTPSDGFCYIFPVTMEKLMGKPMHFPYNEV